jgi:hypothetical protein
LAACLGLSWSRRDKISGTKTKQALGLAQIVLAC